MTLLLAFLLFGGMVPGLAAFLQADYGGWRVIIIFGLGCVAAMGMMFYGAFEVLKVHPNFARHDILREMIRHDKMVTWGLFVLGAMGLGLTGAIVGKAFASRIPAISLGLRTAIGVSIIQWLVAITGVLK